VVRSTDPEVQLLAALADPARLAIVRQLARAGSVCACQLGVCDVLAQPTVSHHLRVLRQAGVVVGERRGTWIYYRLAPGVAERLAALVASLVMAERAPAGSSGNAEEVPVPADDGCCPPPRPAHELTLAGRPRRRSSGRGGSSGSGASGGGGPSGLRPDPAAGGRPALQTREAS
jgi:DNA-binding transcriptional ArsR family regulator